MSWELDFSIPLKQMLHHTRSMLLWTRVVRCSTTQSYRERNNVICNQFTGTIHRVHVVEVVKGPKVQVVELFYGRINHLSWNLGKFQWDSQSPFMKYSTKLGRERLLSRLVIPNVAERKWSGVLPTNFKFRWKTIWDRSRISKETGLLWLIWHRAVVVNVWRDKANLNINIACPMCETDTEESVLHYFWECKYVRQAWSWGSNIIKARTDLLHQTPNEIEWNWKQSIFAYKASCRALYEN